MKRFCTQTLNVPFGTPVFAGCEYIVRLPHQAGDLISRVRIATKNPLVETYIERVDLLVDTIQVESVPGDFIQLENSIKLRSEQVPEYQSLLNKGYLEIPFWLVKQGHFLAGTTKTEVRIKFGATAILDPNTYLLVDYSIVDSNETLNKHRYQKVRQIQRIQVPLNSNTITIDTAFTGPIFEFYFVVRDLSNNIIDGLSSVSLKTNDLVQFSSDAQTLKYLDPLKYHRRVPRNPFGIYSFALYPENAIDPSGHLNFSQIQNQRFNIQSTQTGTVTIYAQSHSFLYGTKPIFESSEILLGLIQGPQGSLGSLPVYVSYINYLNSVTLYFSSAYPITANVISTYPVTPWTQDAYSIIFKPVPSSTYVVVSFSSPGFSTQNGYFTFTPPVSSNVMIQETNQTSSNVVSITYGPNQNLIAGINAQGSFNLGNQPQGYYAGYSFDTVTGFSTQISSGSFPNQLSKIKSNPLDGNLVISGFSDHSTPKWFASPSGFITMSNVTTQVPGTPYFDILGSNVFVAYNTGTASKIQVVQVAGMYSNSYALTSTGSIYSLGYPATLLDSGHGFTQIAVGAAHILATDSTGTLWVYGSDFYGQIGNGGVSSPLFIQGYYTPLIGSPVPLVVSLISCGANHSLVIRKSDNSLFCTGAGTSGQLPTGGSYNLYAFTQIGFNASKVFCGYNISFLLNKYSNQIYYYGDNNSGQAGDYGLTGQITNFRYDSSTQMSIGSNVTMLSNTSGLYISGYSSIGLGNGLSTLGTGGNVLNIAVPELPTSINANGNLSFTSRSGNVYSVTSSSNGLFTLIGTPLPVSNISSNLYLSTSNTVIMDNSFEPYLGPVSFTPGYPILSKFDYLSGFLIAGTPILGYGYGGTVSYSGNYKVHTFLTNGTFTLLGASTPCDILIVGGGGGSGNGGGGAGGLIYQTGVSVPAGTYSATVGAGGSYATNGSPSSFLNLVALGGGAGGTCDTNYVALTPGQNGGSGGGAGGTGSLNIVGIGSQGQSGGLYNSGSGGGGGGGGYTSSGYPSQVTTNGGSGLVVFGSTYAAGGSGTSGGVGTPNTGNGGSNGYSGGSGIVIVRYLNSSGNVTSVGTSGSYVYVGFDSGIVTQYDQNLNFLGSKTFKVGPLVLSGARNSNLYVMSTSNIVSYDGSISTTNWSLTSSTGIVSGFFNNFYYANNYGINKNTSTLIPVTNCTINDLATNYQTGQVAACGYSLGSGTIGNPGYSLTSLFGQTQTGFIFTFDGSGNVNPVIPQTPYTDFFNTPYSAIQGSSAVSVFSQPQFYPPKMFRYPPTSLKGSLTVSNQAWGNGTYRVGSTSNTLNNPEINAFDFSEAFPGWQTYYLPSYNNNTSFVQISNFPSGVTTTQAGNNILGQFGLQSQDTWTFTSNASLTFSNIAEGNLYTVAVDTLGSPWVLGQNNRGQLGSPGLLNTYYFVKVPSIGVPVSAIACGNAHSLFLTSIGTLYSCGANDSGQLGLGTFTDTGSITQVTGLTGTVTAIACGAYHSLIIINSTLYSCGNNSSGQLGLGTQASTSQFSFVSLNVLLVSGGDSHTVFTIGNTVYGTGDNSSGQLGFSTSLVPRSLSPIALTGLPNSVLHIACGVQMTMVSTTNGQYLAAGLNTSGQLGLGLLTSPVTSFTQGTLDNFSTITNLSTSLNNFTVALTASGQAYMCGSNVYHSASGTQYDANNQFINLTLPGPITLSNVYIVDNTGIQGYLMNVYSGTSWSQISLTNPLSVAGSQYGRIFNISPVIPNVSNVSLYAPNIGGPYSLAELALYSGS
jgi:alpha-tubulin suppressor-like RCC1 family protein